MCLHTAFQNIEMDLLRERGSEGQQGAWGRHPSRRETSDRVEREGRRARAAIRRADDRSNGAAPIPERRARRAEASANARASVAARGIWKPSSRLPNRRVEAIARTRSVLATEGPRRVVVPAARCRADIGHPLCRRAPAAARGAADSLEQQHTLVGERQVTGERRLPRSGRPTRRRKTDLSRLTAVLSVAPRGARESLNLIPHAPGSGDENGQDAELCLERHLVSTSPRRSAAAPAPTGSRRAGSVPTGSAARRRASGSRTVRAPRPVRRLKLKGPAARLRALPRNGLRPAPNDRRDRVGLHGVSSLGPSMVYLDDEFRKDSYDQIAGGRPGRIESPIGHRALARFRFRPLAVAGRRQLR